MKNEVTRKIKLFVIGFSSTTRRHPNDFDAVPDRRNDPTLFDDFDVGRIDLRTR